VLQPPPAAALLPSRRLHYLRRLPRCPLGAQAMLLPPATAGRTHATQPPPASARAPSDGFVGCRGLLHACRLRHLRLPPRDAPRAHAAPPLSASAGHSPCSGSAALLATVRCSTQRCSSCSTACSTGTPAVGLRGILVSINGTAAKNRRNGSFSSQWHLPGRSHYYNIFNRGSFCNRLGSKVTVNVSFSKVVCCPPM
jgi:hypothetical protein